MKSANVEQYAADLIQPELADASRSLGERLQKFRFDITLKTWERDRLTEEAVEAEVRSRIKIVSTALCEVVETSKVVIAEADLQAMFTRLVPTVDSLKTELYQACGGVGLTTGVGIGVGIDTGYRSGTEKELARLRLVAASSGRPGPYAGRDIVFISCGQVAAEEISLGETLANLVNDRTSATGYFARNQQSLTGVSEHILGALGSAIGLIAVLHRRDSVQGAEGAYRGSVWIEQEIAIATFRQQILREQIEVVAYYEDGVQLEGLRGSIILNAIRFTRKEDVVSDFTARLGRGLFAGALRN